MGGVSVAINKAVKELEGLHCNGRKVCLNAQVLALYCVVEKQCLYAQNLLLEVLKFPYVSVECVFNHQSGDEFVVPVFQLFT